MRPFIPLAAALLVLVISASAAPTYSVCTAVVTSRASWPGRIVTVTVPPTCPAGGRAFVRFASRTGSQPDSPPGHFTLERGQQLTRRVPTSWWVEGRDRFTRWSRIKEVIR